MNNEVMISTSTKKKHWWSKFKSHISQSNKGKCKEDDEDEVCSSNNLNVNEEYKEVFRTNSYMAICTKLEVQVQLQGSITTFDHHRPRSSSSSSTCFTSPHSRRSSSNYMHFSENLLEPRQEDVNHLIKYSNLQSLLIDYFEASREAGNICEMLLNGIHKTRSNHWLIEKVIKLSKGGEARGIVCSSNDMSDQCQDMVTKHLTSFTKRKNPMSSIINGEINFAMIHDSYATLFQKLISKKSKIKEKQRVRRLVVPELLLGFCNRLMEKISGRRVKVKLVEGVASQFDVAARGVYILINDLDMEGRLVKRVHDEVEHTRELAEICVKNKKSQNEALKELELQEEGFVEQLEELEQHINLCFLTINRSRRSVIQHILSPSLINQ